MTYVANKEKSSHEVGFTSSVYRMAESTTEEQLLETIEFLNNDDESNDRDDDWEWECQDDFGDPWDQEEDQ